MAMILDCLHTLGILFSVKHVFSIENSLQVVELSSRPANCCQQIPSNRFLDGFPDPSQFAADKLTHNSSKPQRPSDSPRSWQRILLSGDVHPNPGPTTKYPCPVCARNVTGRGVSYLCNRCSGSVHSKCSGLQNAAEYRRIKDWVCSSCNFPPTLPKLQPLPTSIPTQAVDGNSFTVMQFNANGIGNKLTELGEFLKRHNVRMAVIQESKLSSNSKTPASRTSPQYERTVVKAKEVVYSP